MKRRWALLIGIGLFASGLMLGSIRTMPTAQLGRIKDQLTGSSQRAGISDGAVLLGAADRAFTRKADIVMVGDSLTQFGRWNEAFPHLPPGTIIANRGISGDSVAGLLQRTHIIRAVRAEQTFLMIGINDIAAGRDAAAIASDYEAAVSALKPETRLFVQSTLPCAHFRCDRQTLKTVAQLNIQLRAIAARHSVGFIDVAGKLAPDGVLPEALSTDGLHLNATGYQRWSAVIAPHIKSATKNSAQNSAEPL